MKHLKTPILTLFAFLLVTGAISSCQKSETATLATVTTNTTTVAYYKAFTGGVITNKGNSAITACGVCFSDTITPTIANSIVPGSPDSTTFTSTITVTTPGTYFVRAYATNNAGTAYGNEQSFVVQ
jgi:hypothetical protein